MAFVKHFYEFSKRAFRINLPRKKEKSKIKKAKPKKMLKNSKTRGLQMPENRLTFLEIYFIISVDISHKTDRRREKIGNIFTSKQILL